MRPDQLRSTYDSVAEAYAERFVDELTRKPFDRQLLDRIAVEAPAPRGMDVGCGPGHVGRYLQERGLDVTGVDLSPGMIAVAQRLNPALRFEVADMRALPVPDGRLGAVVAFYSLIHVPREEVPGVLREFARALMPAGRLLIAVHRGSGTIRRGEFLGRPVPFDAELFEPEQLLEMVEAQAFERVTVTVRAAYDFELPTERLYLSATRSA